MAAQVKSEATKKAEIAVPQERDPPKDKSEITQVADIVVSQDQEPCKGVENRGVAMEIVKVAEENAAIKQENESKTGDVVVEEGEKKDEADESSGDVSPLFPEVENITSFREESNLLCDLKEHEKKALFEMRSKIEEAILANKLFKEKDEQVEEPEKAKLLEEELEKAQKPAVEGQDKEKKEIRAEEEEKPAREKVEEKEKSMQDGEEENKSVKEGGEQEKTHVAIEENVVDIDKDIVLWGVPLLPSKGDMGTDIILLKFLRAREFKVDEAFEMLKNTLHWRKEYNIDSILDEDFGTNLASAAYINGMDREGHPVCYNIFGVFENDEVYNQTFETEEKCDKFLRWRFQLMEKGIRKLNFKPGGAFSLLQINDLKNTPGPSKKELRLATKHAIGLLQDNYPEFVARNIFINVPFWYYAFNAILSPFLTQRTKSKFVFARPARVTEVLLRYIAIEEIPVHYGGLKRENDSDFSIDDGVSEVIVKAGSAEAIEIPAPEVGTLLIWDLTTLGWEVKYKEEFVPTDEESYTIIVSKERKMDWQEESVRNSFKNKEPGKLVLTIENGSYKKKRVLFRYKTKNSSSN
ncbi:hypothetical protein L1049_022171 [Liquidambar formosana]|uniref:Patellin-4 n=1 Tax=Liquidambar formosana TaxID=63359 RepID=A0AAP0WPW1_LIQFO